MKLLLDTHVILWGAGQPEMLSERARQMLMEPRNALFFSAASIWEVVIKRSLAREDFKVDPCRLRKMLILNKYIELPITSEHVLRVDTLPFLHRDPFDRILIAQARSEGMLLLTADSLILQYEESIMAV